jgi:hypothetical protein
MRLSLKMKHHLKVRVKQKMKRINQIKSLLLQDQDIVETTHPNLNRVVLNLIVEQYWQYHKIENKIEK